MNELMKLYLKLFLGMFIPFALCFGLLGFLTYDDSFLGLRISLYISAAVGAIASISLGSAHIFCVRRWSFLKSDRPLGVRHIREFEILLPYDGAFELCVQSLSSIKRCRILEEDQVRGSILAKTGLTWKAFGDLVSFGLRKIDDDRTHVEVTSKPGLHTRLVDFGMNLDNVERLTKFLKQNS